MLAVGGINDVSMKVSLLRAGTARFINQQIGTVYTLNDVYHMRRRDKMLSSNIRRLVRDFPGGPVDPKPRKEPR
jgi:hypothetical protein